MGHDHRTPLRRLTDRGAPVIVTGITELHFAMLVRSAGINA
jgi:hypothetical protein